MSKWLVPLLGLGFLVAVGTLQGCQGPDRGVGVRTDGTALGTVDACAECDGVQPMTSDGRCPECSRTVDVCPTCRGQQKAATADGRCPSCGTKVVVAGVGVGAGATAAEASVESPPADAASPASPTEPAGATRDACAFCAGMQKATADGRCPACDRPAAASAARQP